MLKIKLYNRDGADMWLEKIKDVDSNISDWKIKVDDAHSYCLEYIRCSVDLNKDITMIDPSGGPMICIGDSLDDYEVVDILKGNTLRLSNERTNNK